jgi:acetylornithine/succinyldiaminopimelate/putrescine aminotransferase
MDSENIRFSIRAEGLTADGFTPNAVVTLQKVAGDIVKPIQILRIAKGMGGGIPIGAFVASKEHMSTFTNNPILGHITTFGGNALACAASLATIEAILEEGLIESVPTKEKLIRDLLVHPKIEEIKGKGLLLAACFDSNEIALKVMNACYSKGLITDWFLFCDNALRIAPPLTITHREIVEACVIFLEAINGLE